MHDEPNAFALFVRSALHRHFEAPNDVPPDLLTLIDQATLKN